MNDNHLSSLVALLALGLTLGCHFLAFRRPLRSKLGRAFQVSGKLRLLAVASLAPLSFYLWLRQDHPWLLLLNNLNVFYWLGTFAIDFCWLMLAGADSRGRSLLRLAWLAGLALYAARVEPQCKDLALAIATTLLVLRVSLRLREQLFASPLKAGWLREMRHRLLPHSYLVVVAATGYFAIRAWTVIPITSGQLSLAEQGLAFLGGLMGVELMAVFCELALRRQQRSAEFAHLTSDALRALLYCGLGAVLLTRATNKDLSSLALSSAFFSVGLGFALRPSLGNLVAGLVMRLSQDFSQGEFVRIGDLFGLITNIDWRSVELGTLSQDRIRLPHSQVAKSVFVNYSRPNPSHASLLEVKLPSHVAPGTIRSSLLEILAEIPQVLASPQPEVYLMDLSGEGNLYRVRWWIAHIGQRPQDESAVLHQLTYGLERRHLRPVQPIMQFFTPEES